MRAQTCMCSLVFAIPCTHDSRQEHPPARARSLAIVGDSRVRCFRRKQKDGGFRLSEYRRFCFFFYVSCRDMPRRRQAVFVLLGTVRTQKYVATYRCSFTTQRRTELYPTDTPPSLLVVALTRVVAFPPFEPPQPNPAVVASTPSSV